MSGVQEFLARWSRRKRKAATDPAARADSEQNAQAGALRAAPAVEPAAPAPPLPSIESIGAAADLAPFLAPGVAADLTRAALRRAWTADPAIRDFIGLAENAWDFNAPGGVPGFGVLSSEDVKRLVEALLRDPDRGEAPLAPEADGRIAASTAEPEPIPPPRKIAVQHARENENGEAPHAKPRHGGSLPD